VRAGSYPHAPEATEQSIIVQRLLATRVSSSECHGCGGTDQLLAYPFALAKTVNVERNWAGTAASLALAAATIAMIGFGVFQTPGKRTTYRLVRMNLILCANCRSHRVNYELHPWWNDVYRLGYTQFLDRFDLETIR
jgi:hypothetical protein